MGNFIEDYLQNPSKAIASAAERVRAASWYDIIDDEIAYSQIASPEFRLFEEMVFSPESGMDINAGALRPIA